MAFFEYRASLGGVNFRSSEALTNQGRINNEFAYIQNLDTYQSGALSVMPGKEQLNTGVTDATAILGLDYYINAGVTYQVYVKASGNAYVLPLGGGAEGSPIKTGLSTTATPKFVRFIGKLICFNGEDVPWIWDGTTAADMTGYPAAWGTTQSMPSVVSNLPNQRLLVNSTSATSSTYWWCEQGNPNAWWVHGSSTSDAGFVSDPYSDNSAAVAMEEYGQNVVIHTEANRIYLFGGTNPDDYAIVPLASNRSAAGKYSTASINSVQYFFTGDSILPIQQTPLNQIQLGQGQEISYKIKPLFSGNQSLPILSMAPSLAKDTVLLADYSRNQLLAYLKQNGETSYSIAAVFNLDNPGWVFRKTGNVTAVAKIGDSIVSGKSDGTLWAEYEGPPTTDERIVRTGWIDFGTPFSRKQSTWLRLLLKAATGYNFTIRVRFDYKEDIVHEIPIISSDTGALYGSATYDSSVYAGSSVSFEKCLITGVYQSIQIEIIDTRENSDLQILSFGFEVDEKTKE